MDRLNLNKSPALEKCNGIDFKVISLQRDIKIHGLLQRINQHSMQKA